MRTSLIGFIALVGVVTLPAQIGRGALKITIDGFADGGEMPATYGCVAGRNLNVSPFIQWNGTPSGAQTVAIILHDTDADVLHWALYNIPASLHMIVGSFSHLPTGKEAQALLAIGTLAGNLPPNAKFPDGTVQLKNSADEIGYLNPCPPPGATHHYVFDFYALDTALDPNLPTRADLLNAMRGHILVEDHYTGLYRR